MNGNLILMNALVIFAFMSGAAFALAAYALYEYLTGDSSENRWITIDDPAERLPRLFPTNTAVLAWDGQQYHIALYHPELQLIAEINSASGIQILAGELTHWQPLPPPPGTKRGGN